VTESPAGGSPPKITDYQYDYTNSGDRLKRVLYPNGRWVEYFYDAVGRRERMIDSTGATTRYDYDPVGRLWKLRDDGGNQLVEYRYDAVGRLERVNKGNGTYTTYQYDDVGQLLHLVNYAPDGGVNSRFDYTYDSRGRRKTMGTLDGAWIYDYDATGQLTDADFTPAPGSPVAAQDLHYEYDAVGNRTRTVLNGVTTEYVANNLNQYSSVGAVAYRYDADGNLTFDGERTYVYDQQNRLVRVSGPAGVNEYEYDALGNRTGTVQNGQRTEYLLDPTGLVNVIAEFNASGVLTAHNLYGLGLVGRAVAGPALHFYDFDGSGSTVSFISTAGAVLNDYHYDPFGGSLLRTGSASNPFEFSGQLGVERDASETYFIRARHYTSTTGRFLQVDPLGLAGGDENHYRYVQNEPIGFADPQGLFRIPLPGGGAIDMWGGGSEPFRIGWNKLHFGVKNSIKGRPVSWLTGAHVQVSNVKIYWNRFWINGVRYSTGRLALSFGAGLAAGSLGRWALSHEVNGRVVYETDEVLYHFFDWIGLNKLFGLPPYFEVPTAVVGAWDANDKLGP
jgi:RHS repeat-associated protein